MYKLRCQYVKSSFNSQNFITIRNSYK